MMKMKRILSVLISVLLLGACQGIKGGGYVQISAAEAKQRMERDDGHVTVDVRTLKEYEEGHIPDAVCIPLEEIGDQMPEELPDRDQVILVYCRSGNRSKQAAEKLVKLGYTEVYEFGGINDWPYETVKGGEMSVLRFESFGGGAEYDAVILDETIASLTKEIETEQSEEPIDGGSVDYIFTVRGLCPGETQLRVEERSGNTGNYDHIYVVTVGEGLGVSVNKLTTEDLDAVLDLSASLVMECNGRNYYGGLEKNASARVFSEKVSAQMIQGSLVRKDKAYLTVDLPWDLPIEKEEFTAKEGDLVLIRANVMCLVTEKAELSGRKLGEINIEDSPLKELSEAECLEVLFWLEWSE